MINYRGREIMAVTGAERVAAPQRGRCWMCGLSAIAGDRLPGRRHKVRLPCRRHDELVFGGAGRLPRTTVHKGCALDVVIFEQKPLRQQVSGAVRGVANATFATRHVILSSLSKASGGGGTTYPGPPRHKAPLRQGPPLGARPSAATLELPWTRRNRAARRAPLR